MGQVITEDGEMLWNHVRNKVDQDPRGKEFSDDQKKQVAGGVTQIIALSNNPKFTSLFTARNDIEFNKALNVDAVAKIKECTGFAINNVAKGKEAFPREDIVEPFSYSPSNVGYKSPSGTKEK